MVQTDDLDKKTVAQLKEIAKGMGLTGLSKMKKADLIAAIQEKSSEPEASEPAPEPEPEVAKEVPVEAESTPVEEEVAKEAPEPEEVAAEAPEPAPEPEAAEEPPVEPVEAEPAPEPEPVPEPEASAPEPAPEEAVAEAPAQSPKAEKPKVVVKPPTKLQLKIRGKYDIAALKTEKKTLKGQIADAIESRDSAKVKELRNRKKEIRRILKKAS